MEYRIQSASRDECHPLVRCIQSQFENTVGSVLQQFDLAIREPVPDQTDHLMRPHADGLVALAQSCAHFWSGCQHAQEGQGPSLLCPGEANDDGHHDPAQPRAAHRAFFAGEGAIAVMAAFADLAAPAPFERLVNDQLYAGSGWHKRLDDEQEQLAVHG
jgi:hypothetical protein